MGERSALLKHESEVCTSGNRPYLVRPGHIYLRRLEGHVNSVFGFLEGIGQRREAMKTTPKKRLSGC